MARLLLIVVLLAQPLMAQAMMADMLCMHAVPGQRPVHSAATHHGTRHQQTAPDNAQSHCHCGCAMAGHCSGSAIGIVSKVSSIHFSPRAITPTTTTNALAAGYSTPPYRPPSATA